MYITKRAQSKPMSSPFEPVQNQHATEPCLPDPTGDNELITQKVDLEGGWREARTLLFAV
jgi:hypothetical protein